MLRVTRRMREGVLRKQDQLGRVSRDQFACLLPRIAGEGVAILAANKILGALEAPIPIGDRSFDADAVIGIAMYPGPRRRSADAGAQRQARGGRRARPRRSASPSTIRRTARAKSATCSTKRGCATPWSRALSDLPSRRNSISPAAASPGWSACCAGRDDELGEVSEARAIEAAETSGLIREVTWWVYNNALRLCAEFAHAGIDASDRPESNRERSRATRFSGVRGPRAAHLEGSAGTAGDRNPRDRARRRDRTAEGNARPPEGARRASRDRRLRHRLRPRSPTWRNCRSTR